VPDLEKADVIRAQIDPACLSANYISLLRGMPAPAAIQRAAARW
jgi:hypothetical protein